MKKVLLSVALLAFPTPFISALHAQTPTPNVVAAQTVDALIPVARAPLAQIAGSIEAVGNGRRQSAEVIFSAPDALFVHIRPDASQNIPDEIYVANGATQTTYNVDSKRVRLWNWSSAQQPWRSQALADGGPANIVLWGWNPQLAAKYYTLKAAKSGEITTMTMTAKASARRQVYDSQRSGGRGDRVVFAVAKRAIYDWPRAIVLVFDANGKIISQERRDERNRVLDKTIFSWSGNFPATATTRDANNFIAARWTYKFKSATVAPESTTFNLNAATKNSSRNQIVEDAELLPIAEYRSLILLANMTKAGQANTQFNLGMAYLRQSEDVKSARDALEQAAKLAPQAVAPQLELFNLALQTRDIARAKIALNALQNLLGENDSEFLERRAQLALQQRDWKTAQETLTNSQLAKPDSSSTRLQLARVQLLRGEVAAARAQLLSILAQTSSFKSEGDALFTTTQSASQANVALLWANSFADDELKNSAANLPTQSTTQSEAQRLARALLDLRRGEAVTSAATTFATRDTTFLEAIGNAQALAGKSADAIKTFQNLATNGDMRTSTRAHRNLIVLGAMSGDAAKSLASFQVVARRSDDEEERAFTRRILFDAWQRNGRGDALERVLVARSIAPNATDDDARLWLAWQENSATPAAIGETVRSFSNKYRNVAWWQSRLAEQLSSEAEPLKKDPQGRGIRLTNEALAAVERAITLDKTQSYYAVQRAFILTFRANDLRKAGVSDATATVEAVDAAQSALDELRRTRTNDPEVLISVAAAQQALTTTDKGAIADFGRGLEGGLPGRSSASGERHNTAFAARQALAIALRRQKKWSEAAAQYDILMAGAQSAGEEVGVALNYLVLLRLNAGGDTKAIAQSAAQLLQRLSVEPWPLDEAEEATRFFVSTLQNDAELWPQIISVLRRGNSESAQSVNAQLALGYLTFSIQSALMSMEAQATDDANKTYFQTVQKQIAPFADAAEASLETVATGNNAVLAARAHSLLANRNVLKIEYSIAAAHLRSAILIEPENIALRLTLARLLVADKKADDATQVLQSLQQTRVLDAPTLQSVAAIQTQIGQSDEALKTLETTWRRAQFDSATPTQTAQSVAFGLARARFGKAQFAGAAALYNALADASWSRLERAAALLDWEDRLRIANKTADADAAKTRRDALKLSPAELQNVREFLKAL